jgi:GT2 family glycosyltransferase
MVEPTIIPQQDEIVCSVCIANFNGSPIIDACLRSVLSQNPGFRYEIIIHDDASSDASADHIATHYPDVTLIRSDHNVGYCVSNNRMAARARGRYLLFLNNDAELQPLALTTLYAEATRLSEPAILSLPQYDAETGALIDRGERLDPFFNPLPNLDPGVHDVPMVIGACLWLPRSLWNELGGFPEWFHMLAEDMYLCCKARLAGYPVRVTSASGYRHQVGHSLGGGKVRTGRLSLSLTRRRLSERNKTFLIALVYPWPVLFVLLPVHALLLLVEGTVLSVLLRQPSLLTQVYLHALTQLWVSHSTLCHERRWLRTVRRSSWSRFLSGFTLFPHKLRLLVRYGIPRARS